MAKTEQFQIKLKRAYDPPERTDGHRVLVDRVWPRGISKESLRLDEWLKDLAPSTALRKWFNHEPAKWDAFTVGYSLELDEQPEAVAWLLTKCRSGPVTLVFGAKDTEHNNAVALKAYLEQRSRK